MSGIGIIAALRQEVQPLVKGWAHREPARHVHVWTRGDVAVACAGIGADRGMLAVRAVLTERPMALLISAGIAGACDPKLRAGEVVRARVVVDARTGERFDTGAGEQTVVTSPTIAGVREKQRLFEAYGAAAVDMEGATVGRMARAEGLRFLAVKTISDDAASEMDEMNGYVTNDGQFRTVAFAGYVALRPALWGRMVALARNSNRAAEALAQELKAQIEAYRREEGVQR